MKVRWTTPARRDFVEAINFLRSASPRAAKVLANRVEAHIKVLEEYPLAGPEGRAPGTRELVVPRTRYVTAYRVAAGEVWILRFLHHAQDWPRDLADIS